MNSKDLITKLQEIQDDITRTGRYPEIDLEIIHEGRTIMSDITRVKRSGDRIIFEIITNEDEKARSIIGECLKESEYYKKVRLDRKLDKEERSSATVKYHEMYKTIADLLIKRAGGKLTKKKALEIARAGREQIEAAAFGGSANEKSKPNKTEGRLEEILKLKDKHS